MNYKWILIIALYVVLTHLIAQYIGSKRSIGHGEISAMVNSVSPVIGLMITLSSKPIDKKN